MACNNGASFRRSDGGFPVLQHARHGGAGSNDAAAAGPRTRRPDSKDGTRRPEDKKCNTVIRSAPGAPSQTETSTRSPVGPTAARPGDRHGGQGLQISDTCPDRQAHEGIALQRRELQELATSAPRCWPRSAWPRARLGRGDMGTIVAYERGPKDLQLPYSISMGATLHPGQSLRRRRIRPVRVIDSRIPSPTRRARRQGPGRRADDAALGPGTRLGHRRQQAPIGQIEKAYGQGAGSDDDPARSAPSTRARRTPPIRRDVSVSQTSLIR